MARINQISSRESGLKHRGDKAASEAACRPEELHACTLVKKQNFGSDLTINTLQTKWTYMKFKPLARNPKTISIWR